ncbi:MAG: hypothetical protein AAB381_01415 [Patescibacteria group bacterium]
MPRIKTTKAKETSASSEPEKIDEKILEDATEVETADIEDKTDVPIVPIVDAEEDELAEDEDTLDTEEIDPFGDTWEQ